ncbi:Protein yhjK [Salmonella enterica subsp. enterica]|uniref:Anti-FlhC(2)FlhD(4) factor YdiV n=1 Tax=Salmonella enterica I TaxID=59201 RepID=A0A379W0N1_SALET|nr:Protein yhjK [Salmonella enterica subsp. enterica]
MKSLPVDILKIDKMFVDGLPDDHSMVTAIILMARSLNLQLIAEAWRTRRNARGWNRLESTSRKLPVCSARSRGYL